MYLMSNRSKTIYTGITNGLRKRVLQHKMGINEGFTKKYKLDRLVYWESYGQVLQAIAREKEIKGWLRIRKIQLIVSVNPTWADLSRDLFPDLEEEVQKELARAGNESAAGEMHRSFGRKKRALQDDKG
ncbi:MAG TPA: GIY-YIG nuclease family protein [Candidatus Angelobacter sp.]|nr:GIY-YIG nuclease family protein [Candidatus Angelobacter sp.]